MSLWLGILNVIHNLLQVVDAKIDIIDGLHDVPSVDSADNVFIRDVVGNKNDDHDGNSIRAVSHIINEHTHNSMMIFPLLDNPITLTKASGVWAAMPTPVEIIPADTVNIDFDIHWVHVNNISANGNYIIEIYKGDAGSEILIGTVAVSRTAAQSQEGAVPIQTPLHNENERISAALSSSNNAQDSVLVKLGYHEY